MELRWPQRGDRLFRKGGSGSLAACTMASLRSEGFVAMGFKNAVDGIVQHVSRSGRDDSLILPILFLYRHYIEMQLKETALHLHRWDGKGESYVRTHDLSRLVSILDHPDLKEAQTSPEGEAARRAARECVLEFHRMDPRGTEMRYPDKAPLEQLDLGHLKSTMEGLANYLGAAADQVEEAVNLRD